METSFTVLSSMSPKVANGVVSNTKVATKLALKKNIRRSSHFNKMPTKMANQSVILVEDSSSNEDSSTSPSRSTASSCVINASPIILSDTSCDELENDHMSNIINKYLSTGVKGCSLSETKVSAINKWMDEIDAENTYKGYLDSNGDINSTEKEIQRTSLEASLRGISLSKDLENKSYKENDRNVDNIKLLKKGFNFSPEPSDSEEEKKVLRTVIRAKKPHSNKSPASNLRRKQHSPSPLKTPWKERLEAVCDPDSSGSSLENALPQQTQLKTHLNFNASPETPKYLKKAQEEFSIPKKKNEGGEGGKLKQTKKKPKKQQKEDCTNKDKTEKVGIKSVSTSGTCRSFLESLSAHVPLEECDTSARIFRNNYKTYKTELAAKLFALYNKEVFDDALPSDTPLEWNQKMTRTAGFCYSRKITRRTGQVERKARIVLASKILDSADRLRDTLIHEMCHAATWIIDETANGHGPYWKAWTQKARKAFPELPPIKTCHNYTIQTKYTYRCTQCGYSFGRHRKTLNVERKLCGYCYGTFEVLINKVTKSGETKIMPATPKKEASGFALFVKENYATYRSPQLSHGEVMKLLGHKFSDMKVSTDT